MGPEVQLYLEGFKFEFACANLYSLGEICEKPSAINLSYFGAKLMVPELPVVLKVPGPISQNGDSYSKNASSPNKS